MGANDVIHVANIIAAMIEAKGAKNSFLTGFESVSCLTGFGSEARHFILSLSGFGSKVRHFILSLLCSSCRRQMAVVESPAKALNRLAHFSTHTISKSIFNMSQLAGSHGVVIDIGIHLFGLKDHTGFHTLQGWTNGISVLKILMGIPVITVHFGALFPPFTALTDLLVMLCAKVFVHESGILVLLVP